MSIDRKEQEKLRLIDLVDFWKKEINRDDNRIPGAFQFVAIRVSDLRILIDLAQSILDGKYAEVMGEEEILKEIDFIAPMYYSTADWKNNEIVEKESYKVFKEHLASFLSGHITKPQMTEELEKKLAEKDKEIARLRSALKYIADRSYVAKVKDYADDGRNKWINEFVGVAQQALERKE